MKKQIILTGDRPTGKLHLGHYVGSLRNRVALQNEYASFFIIADFQVLIDHLKDSRKVTENIREVLLDYLAVGINPSKATIFIQSAIPQLTELTMYLSMLVTVARLRRNPTVKDEAQRVNVDSGRDEIVFGFLGYPVSQAADILLFRADLVPVGKDQEPHIEQSRELARRFNRLFGETFPIPRAMVSDVPLLPGITGTAKMSKSLGNAIYLSDPTDVVSEKVKAMYTDPKHVRVADPGCIEGNVVFTYLDAFDPDQPGLMELKDRYRAGGVADGAVKERLKEILKQFMAPIRARRHQYAKDEAHLRQVLRDGCERARAVGEETMKLVREAVGYDHARLLQ